MTEGAKIDELPLRRMPAQARSREKVSRALAAAERLLDRDGPEALTLTQVASEAGLSAGALHQYLPDREAILQVLAARYYQRLESLFDQALKSAGSAQDDPAGALIDVVAEVYRDEVALRSLRLGPGGSEQSRAHKQRMAGLIEELLLVRHWASAAQAPVVARVLFHAGDGVLKEAFRDDGAGDAALLGALKDMIRAYLSAETVG